MKILFTHDVICPAWGAGGLDNSFRKLVQNPRKILKPYIREGMIVSGVLGIGGMVAALLLRNVITSTSCGLFAFSSFWSFGELFEQRKRVAKGWFPKSGK